MVFAFKGEVLTQDGKATSRIVHEFVAESLPDLLDQVTAFLRGCGYPVGQLTEADEPAEQETPLRQEN
jgi:hypothetical protein